VNSAGIIVILRQVVRSVILLLLPIAFASLIVWATAGSSSGSTSDPIFASLWIYLIAHQIPLDLSGSIAGARLTFLPLGALVLVFFAIRSGMVRTLDLLGEEKKRIAVPLFSLLYSFVIAVIAVISSTRDDVVSIKLYLALPISLVLTLAFSLVAAELMPKRSRAPWEIASAWAAAAFGALLLLATLAVLLSLIVHHTALFDLTTVISPGIFGGIALVGIQLLYLPNLIVAALGYLTGAGAHLGSGSLIHPFVVDIDQLPAIPLLAVLPVGPFPWAISAALFVLALGFFMHRRLRSLFSDDRSSALALAAFFLISFLIGSAASGQLITDVLGEVGTSWWLFPLVITGELTLGMALSRTEIWIRARRSFKAQEARDS